MSWGAREWLLLRSSVPLRLFLRVVVLFFALVDKLDSISILPTGVGALPLLIGDEGLDFIDIVELTVCEPQVIPFVETAPDGRDGVRRSQVDELGKIEDVKELGTVADIEPHPVTVGLQTH